MEAKIRTVQLPLDKRDKCFQCQSGSVRLRLCGSCAEALYCSKECQRDAWPVHKIICGHRKNDHLDLMTIHPFLACIAEAARFNQIIPIHRALLHKVMNSPNPTKRPTPLPSGSSAILVILGDALADARDSFDPMKAQPGWWPSALNSNVRERLFRRIMREGYHLSIQLSICIGLLRTLYTTPAGPDERRIRLSCFGSQPISDFGIAKGRAAIERRNRLAYLYTSDRSTVEGDDPHDHYWIYFTTLSGQKHTLDTGLFSCTIGSAHYPAGEYLENIPTSQSLDTAPCYFYADGKTLGIRDALTPEREFSVLRNQDLQKAVESPTIDWPAIYRFIKTISGRKCSEVEEKLVVAVSEDSCTALGRMIQTRAWEQWPTIAVPSVECVDPKMAEEASASTGNDDDEWWDYMAKQYRKRGKASKGITISEVQKAYAAHKAARGSTS